jgi:TP901 family phage tail tape measure protein
MAKRLRTDDIQLNITIKSNKAQAELGELDRRAVKLREEMKGLKKGTEEYAAKSRELSQVKNRMDELRKEVGLTALSMRQLSQRSRELSLMRQHLTPGTEEFKKVNAELLKINARMRELRTGSQQAGVSLNGLAQGFNKYFGIITAFSASILGSVMGFRKLVEEFNEYEKSVSNLSALTGLTGDQLEWLSDKAKEMSTGMVEGNIRITSSAKEIVDAYTVVGSKMPELLQDQEALNEVTKQAMILAKAGNIDLTVAVDALTNTMNQFRLPAEEAANVINQIAAGAKYGAADIDFIGNSITRFGAAANAMGLDVTQSVAMIEVLGKAGLDAEKAGTGLKTFLLKSAQQADEFNVTVVGLDQALHNLNNANLSAAEMTKMFGLEAYIAAQSMLTNIDIYDDLITKLDGTKVAFEMAAVNSDNNAAKLDQARNKAALLRMELGEKLAPALTFSTNSFSYLVKAIIALINNWNTYLNYLGLTISILAIYHSAKLKLLIFQGLENLAIHRHNILLKTKSILTLAHLAATKLLSAGYMLLTGNIAGATQALRVFATIVKTNPLGIMIALLTGLAIAHVKYGKNAQEAKRLEELKSAALEHSNRMYEDVSKSVNNYIIALQNSRYWNNQERIALQESIKIDIKAAKAKLTLIKAKQYEIEQENMRISLWKVMTKSVSSLFSSSSEKVVASQSLLVDSFNEGKKAGEDFNPIINKLTKLIEDYNNQLNELDQTINAEQHADNMITTTIEQLENKINLYRVALRNATFRSEEYYRIQKKIADATKELNSLNSDNYDSLITTSSAYEILTKKISEAQKHIANYVTLGDLTSAQAWQNILRGLMAQKFVLDQLIAAGGDMTKMLDDFREAQLKTGDSIIDSIDAEIDKTIADEIKLLSDEAVDATKKTADAKLDEYNQEVDNFNKRQEMIARWKDASLDAAYTIANATADIYRNQLQAQTDAQIAALNKRRDAELDNENLTAEEREKIEEKYRKQEAAIKTEAFKKQKAADVILSIINTGLAVTRAMAAPPGWPLNMPQVIAAGIAGAAQTAVIASQPVPQFAKGRYDVIGEDDNRAYNVPFMGPATTGIYKKPALVAEKGDELIIDNPTLRNIRVNFPEVLQAIQAARVPQYATGRYHNTEQRTTDSGTQVPFTNYINDMREIVADFKQSISDFKNTKLEAELVYHKFEQFQQKINQTEQNSLL